MIDADLAEFVDDDQAVVEGRLPQKMIEQRCLTASKISGDDRYRQHGATISPRNSERKDSHHPEDSPLWRRNTDRVQSRYPPNWKRVTRLFDLELDPYRRALNTTIPTRAMQGQNLAS